MNTTEALFSALGAIACAGSAALLPAQAFVAGPLLTVTTGAANTSSGLDVDFDRDGKPDLLYVSGNAIWILRDIGMANASTTGTVLVSNQVVTGGQVGSGRLMLAGDINADGNTDLVVIWTSYQTFSTTIRLFPGLPGGQIGAPQLIATTTGTLNLASGDFDGDGDPDLVVTRVGPFTPQLEIYLQDANHVFTLGTARAVNSILPLPAVGDYDGDGIDDIAIVSGVSTFQAEIYRGSPVIGLPLVAPLPTGSQWFVNLGDLDADGRDDLILLVSGATTMPIYFYDPSSVLRPGPVVPAAYPFGRVDIDGDGRLDVVLHDAAVGQVSAYRGDGVGGISSTPLAIPMQGATSPIFRDLDLDGDADLFALAPNNAGIARFENRAIYGAACYGSTDTVLQIGVATPGNSAFSVDIRNALPGALCEVFVALAATPGPCGLQVSPGSILVPAGGFFGLVANGAGGASRFLPIPIGAPMGPFFLQGLVLDPAGQFALGGFTFAATKGRAVELF
ncbi:MAG: VCBS repeat-containing protein [Planctomycetota bacterium]